MSAGYDPFAWYERQLDLEHKAWLAGFDSVEEYLEHEEDLKAAQNGKIAVMFTAAYFYEHREEADHHALNLTLRALLFGSRKEGF